MRFVSKPDARDPSWVAGLDPDLRQEWQQLLDDAESGRQELIANFDQGRDASIKSALYSRYKEFLKRLFRGKCAYCEGKYVLGEPGDVEHFRPKGRVVDDEFKPIRRGDIEHPGYYWLAYEWKNLLPSCTDCNRFRNHERVEKRTKRREGGAGKADRFPLQDEQKRAWKPDDEAYEEAMLIDPTKVDPQEHFEFQTNGVIVPRTAQAKKTLEIFGLNLREDLIDARAKALKDARQTFETYISTINMDAAARRKETAQRLNRILEGEEPYSVMQQLGITACRQHWAEEGITISVPLKE